MFNKILKYSSRKISCIVTRAGNYRGLLRCNILISLYQDTYFNLLLLTLEYSSEHTLTSLHCGSKRDASQTDSHLWCLLVLELHRSSEKKPNFFTTILNQLCILRFSMLSVLYIRMLSTNIKTPSLLRFLSNKEVYMHRYTHTYIHTHWNKNFLT